MQYKAKTFKYKGQITSVVPTTPVERAVINTIKENLLYIDPDSSRVVDWITFNRAECGLSTSVFTHDVSARDHEQFETMKAFVRSKFKFYYDSPNLLRCFSVSENPMSGYQTYRPNHTAPGEWPKHINHEETRYGQFQSPPNYDQRYNPYNVPLGCVETYVALESTGSGVAITAIGSPEIIGPVVEEFSKVFMDADRLVIQCLEGFTDQGPLIIQQTLNPNDGSIKISYDEFYPYLEYTVDGLIAEYRESDAAVLMLHGERGTGKSTLLRTILTRLSDEGIAYSCNSQTALNHPSFTPWLATLPKGAIIAIEDADDLVGTRSSGNQQMSSLLNICDGVAKHDLKVILSTNLTTTKDVDSALLRAGRCFDLIEFRKLTVEQANTARSIIGRPPVIDYGVTEMTLAEALNHKTIVDLKRRKIPSIGFQPR